MSDNSSTTITDAMRRAGEVAEPEAIARLLSDLAGRQEQLSCSAVGAEFSVAGRALAVDGERQVLRIAVATRDDSGTGIRVGGVLEIFVPIGNADLVFATTVAGADPDQKNVYDLTLPSRLRLWRRREHPRGSCFGLVEVILRHKHPAQAAGLTATLRDISNAGLGIAVPGAIASNVQAGDAYDDCVLLLNGKPMAACAIEVLHTRQEADGGALLAGARFANLDEVATTRIAKLIAVLDPLWGEPPLPVAD